MQFLISIVSLSNFRRIALFAALLLTSMPAAEAGTSEWAREAQSAVRLISAQTGIGPSGKIRGGIEFELKPGWKVYWRAPGDAGFPPMPDWSATENARIGQLEWPLPERFSVLGLETLGYEDQVVLPFAAEALDPTQPAAIRSTIRYLTCKEICIPYEARLAMTLAPGGVEPAPEAHDIGKFASRVPRRDGAALIGIESLYLEATAKTLHLVVSARSEMPFTAPDLFVEGPPGLAYGKPKVSLDGGTARLRVAVFGHDGTPAAAKVQFNGTPFTLTLRDGARGFETTLPAVAASSRPDDAAGWGRWQLALILAFAFLGGLILNLMPCVLPVLAIKLLALVKHGGGEPTTVRIGFLASAAGVVTAMLVLASGLIALKGAGAAIGWGIQFQQPWFLAGMAVMVTLFACNMWGFFEFRLPGGLADAALRSGNARGYLGHFLQGAFAALLATPCSAPFLGTAVGFALARGPIEIGSVFFMLGAGLAAPYLLVGAFPALATRLPAPGPWMVKLKIGLGLALAATAVWLISVIATTSGSGAAWTIIGVLVALTLWLGLAIDRMPELGKVTPVILTIVTVLAMGTPYVGDIDDMKPMAPKAGGTIAWRPFEPTKIAAAVGAGRTVLIDVTADWCITCQINKALVLDQGRIREILNGGDVLAMQADWTRPDAVIAGYLAGFGRYGIPFNAVYGPKAPDGIVLPELLSEAAVMDALRKASSGPTLQSLK